MLLTLAEVVGGVARLRTQSALSACVLFEWLKSRRTNLRANSYAKAVSSSCRVRSVCMLVFGSEMAE